ncbi:arginine deiminase [Carboxylicivirga linearis]|uniref:arginine deiminase n=1 Tax=Carboxylicivirga linearis TaxID=1628157 RepID=A0ABS5JST7_9BACT|nr:arginine deiminase family protein [Carboxylicivirga linearis]MBS2097935.1 arginine deiminase [Carboxylicivirga linearis]
MMKAIDSGVYSEIGELEGVILHTPGKEVENMTPTNAERALYSDILNLSVAVEEYKQLAGVLEKITPTYQVKDLLTGILEQPTIKSGLIEKICTYEQALSMKDLLLDLPADELARQLIEGVDLQKNSLTTFLSDERYALRPLHNFFFTRDASVSVYDNVLISKMANKVREREAIIMEAIFHYSDYIKSNTINPNSYYNVGAETTIEGGDVLIARDDVLIIGNSARTTTQGVDFIINQLKQKKDKRYVVVQQLPGEPESFIHLDMVFTLLNKDACMVYEPLIMKLNRYSTILISLDNGEVVSIEKKDNLISCLKELGMDLKPIPCGGSSDIWTQEREQWHSGANFFAIAPGKVMGYARNVYTMEEMNNNGYEIIKANDVIDNKVNLADYEKYVIAIGGSELARGGGGARCMTMPVKRKAVNW